MAYEPKLRAELFILPEPTDAEAPAIAQTSVKPPANVAASEPRQERIMGRTRERVHLSGMLCMLEPPGWFSLFMDDEFDMETARQMIDARIAELGVDRELVETYLSTPSNCTAEEGQAWGRQPFEIKMNRFRLADALRDDE